MKYKVDVVRIRENSITLNGWVIGKSPESKATFRVEDERHNPVKFKYVPTRRDDVSQIYYKKCYDRDFGFDIRFPYERGKNYFLLIRCEGKQAKIKYNEELIARRSSVAHKRIEKLKDLMNMETVHVAMDFWKEHGLKALVVKSKHKLQGLDNDYDYGEWYELTKPTEEELEAQRKKLFDFEPRLSIAIPAYKTPERYLKEMLDSILAQTYTNWEVCIADGSPKGESLERVLRRYAEKDSRIRYQILGENKGIAGNTNAAMDMARGDFLVLADHDDTLPPHALYEVVKAVNERPGAQVIYSDEDKLDMDGKALFDPHFKPDFNPDLLTSVNYICHLFVVRMDLLETVGRFRQEFDGAQDYDFIFRCTEAAKEVYHIPKVLYHWRCHQNSTASNPESKRYAFEAGARAIMAHYERMGIEAESVVKGVDFGIYHTKFKIQGEPLVSVVIPNKDHWQDLDVCVKSLMERATYRNLEFVIVENNSAEAETFAYYERLQAEHGNVRVVTWEREFNYSAINNFGAGFAKGEYLLLLNNDTEIIEPDCIQEMLGFCQREDVGIVGARLLYADDTIQHAGVVVGFGGIAGHTFIGLHKAENSYFHRAMCAQDYSAVTAACMMTKKSVFDQVGGLSEELAVAFNDIDYCMKVRSLGKLVVYAPYALLYHYESKSRGLEDTPEKIERFNREVAVFIKKWPDIIQNGDPYYNPNLTLRKSNFALRDLLKEKIGEPYDLSVYDRFAPEEQA
ncbi:glycosyltransferase family 2 protein [Enterocloster lavalensis]|uniref:Glycosyltransferase, GT2 family n=1 Tax=Enterocloster lavalensis TaxID=460384 RepID=A0A1I0HWG7_9FIRM|nr:glycosyltransferase family 2 protein [Enterocloster lavalensis]SET88485.1 Glycosyltransferase, GT2 family [Enterocloster lavalensis]